MVHVWPFLTALGLSLVVTPLAMKLARRLGKIAPPRPDRWHKKPTPMMGGIAIFVAYTATLLLFAPMRIETIGLLVAGGAIFTLGLVDDLKSLRPSVKLAGQVAAACALIPFGIHAIFVMHPVLAVPATLFWIVAVTNAFNLLDNMDGLSSGVSAISSAFIFCVAVMTQQPDVATLAIALCGAALGFLAYNFNPARVFMGDCGSLFLGFNLGALTIMGTWREASNLFLVLLVPLLVLAVPLFDTTLVTILRKFSGRAISQGGRDHSSHRLVALGLSERNAVLVLYALCAAFGGLALLGLWLDLFVTAIAVGVLLVLIVLFGVFLGEAKVYPHQRGEELRRAAPPIFRQLIAHKSLIIELSADLVLISAAYLGAYLIRFEGSIPEPVPQQMHQLLPIVLPVQIAAFVLFGIYQEEWRYGGLRANLKLAWAVAFGSAVSFALVVLFTNFTFYSRAVFVIAALLSLLFALGARSTLRILREWTRARRGQEHRRRVVVVGAGDAAERVVQELRRHHEIGLLPVALVDDDPSKRGRRVHGVPVLGSCADLHVIVQRVAAEEIVFAIPSARSENRQRLLQECARAGVPYRVALGVREIVHFGAGDLVRPARIEDHLARVRLPFDEPKLADAVRGKSVLVLGVASAASGELLRWALELGATRVYVCDADAVTLSAKLDLLRQGRADDVVVGRVCHLLDEDSLARVLRELRPDVVVSTTAIRSESLARLDLAGTLERNFLAAANVARQCTAAGVRTLVVWSAEPWDGGTGVPLRLGELAAAALGPPNVVVLRTPPIAEDPDNALGDALHRAVRGETLPPLVAPEEEVELALATEVAALTLQAISERDATMLRFVVPPEPLLALVSALLKAEPIAANADRPATASGEKVVSAPRVETVPLRRPAAVIVERVLRDVREALRGGRLDDALAATSLLVPGYESLGAGAVVALDPARRVLD